VLLVVKISSTALKGVIFKGEHFNLQMENNSREAIGDKVSRRGKRAARLRPGAHAIAAPATKDTNEQLVATLNSLEFVKVKE